MGTAAQGSALATGIAGALVTFLVAGCRGPAPAERAGAGLAITGVTVIDVEAGAARPNRRILVSEGRITAIVAEDGSPVPAGALVVDGRGVYAIPGLWDAHVHAHFHPSVRESFLPLFLAHGVTGIRDMGGRLDLVAATREETATGAAVPRLAAAGPILDGAEEVDPRVAWRVTSPREARAAVDSLARAGVDFVKVYTQLEPDVFRSVAAAAREAGLPVAGHVPFGVPEAEAAATLRTVEHMRAETGGFCTRAAPEPCRESFAAFRRHGTWQTPTLTVRRVRSRAGDPGLRDDPRLAGIPAALRAEWEAERVSRRERGAGYAARVRAEHADELWLAGALDSAGIGILAGSDAGNPWTYPGSGLHDELALLVEAGLSPAAALRAGTVNPTRALGVADSLGVLAPGRAADLVLLEGDPLASIAATRRIQAVVLRGRLLDRQALDSLLAAAAARAARSD